MPSRNVAIVEQIYEAISIRDFSTLRSLLAPEIHITRPPGLAAGSGSSRGRASARRLFERMLGHPSARLTVKRLIDSGDRVAVIGRISGSGKGSETGVDLPLMHLWELRDGVAVAMEIASDQRAIQAALARVA